MTNSEEGPVAISGEVSVRRHLVLLSLMFFCIFAGAGAQQAYLVQYLVRVTGWGRVACSMVVSTLYFTMVVFRVVNLAIFRHWTDKTFTLAGSTTYLLFTLVLAATFRFHFYGMVLAAAVKWGIGAAMMWAGTAMQVLHIGDRLGGRHGTGMGILYSSTHAGWFTGAVILGIVYEHLPFELLYVLYVVAAACTLPGVLIAFFLPPTGPAARDIPTFAALKAVTAQSTARIAGLLQFLSALAYGVILGAFGRYIEQTCGAEWVWVSVALYPATRIVFSPLSGRLTDRFGHGPVLVGGWLCGAVGLGGLALAKGPEAAILAGVALGLLNSTVPVVVSAMVGEVSRRQRHLVYGVLFGMRDLGVAVAAVGINLLGVHFQMNSAFGFFAVVFLFCAVLSTRIAPSGKALG